MMRFVLTGMIYLGLLVGFHNVVSAAVFQIQPYAQWTFDTPMEQIIYRQSGQGFPIKMMNTGTLIALYDSTGNLLREIPRDHGDQFILNSNHTGFMLVQEHPSILSERQERLYSFQVFNSKGVREYTTVHAVDLIEGKLSYHFTDYGNILLTERGESWIIEIDDQDTLLNINNCQSDISGEGTPNALVGKLKLPNELVSAVSCLELGAGDSSFIELRLWNDARIIEGPLRIKGELQAIHSLPASDYYFLEVGHGADTELTLFNRSDSLTTFPWKSWKISPLGQQAVFVISDKDLNVINLGDGSVAASYHPIDLSTISDAIFLQEWGLFLYLRYEPFYRKDGRQAFRNFELEGVNKAGRIVHRSSFGTWSYSLPKIAQIGQDIFAIHIHNAVLMYSIAMEQN